MHAIPHFEWQVIDHEQKGPNVNLDDLKTGMPSVLKCCTFVIRIQKKHVDKLDHCIHQYLLRVASDTAHLMLPRYPCLHNVTCT